MARRELTDDEKAHIALVEKYARIGDLLTYTVCMGHVREAYFTGRDGIGICGRPTADTRKLEGWTGRNYEHNDIHPLHVTHINRDPVAAIPELVVIAREWQERA